MLRRRAAAIMGGLQYWQRVIHLLGRSNILTYTPYNEQAGTTAFDIVGAYNATYGATLPTLANATSPGKRPCPTWAGTSGGVTYPAGLASAFPGAEGAIILWVNPTAASYTDGVAGRTLRFYVDVNNNVTQNFTTVDNQITTTCVFGGTGHSNAAMYFKRNTWYCQILSWSASESKFRNWVNSGIIRTDDSALGTWAGTPTAIVGTSNNLYFLGNLADFIMVNRYVTFAEAQQICDWTGIVSRLTVLGDSNAGGAATENWTTQFAAGYTTKSIGLNNRASAGATIASTMATQVTAAASDNAGIIINELGGNDDNAGNMTTLQATYEAQTAILKANHPNATIYGMTPFPRWTDVGGGTEVDKGNIRTAIQAACTAQGITCLDGYTGPGIVVGDTSDGVHLVTSGDTKVSNWLLGLNL